MLRKLVVVFGVIEALFPEQVVALLGKFGYRTEGATEPRSWLVTAAKIEGILLATAGVVGILAHRYGRTEATDEETADAEPSEETTEERDGEDGE